MNAVAVQQCAADEFIFGDQLLHARFFTSIELLAQIMMAAPQPVISSRLIDEVGQAPRLVRALLQSLCKYGLIAQDEKIKDAWHCSDNPSAVTLADVFSCVSAADTEPDSLRQAKCGTAIAAPSRTATQQSVDLLLMQATMTVNQVVLQHLQQFDLGRLMAVASPHSLGAAMSLRSRPSLSEPC